MRVPSLRSFALATLVTLLSVASAHAADVVRLGNLKFAHYGAVSYMKELGPKYGLDVKEQVFAKGIDIVPAIIAGDIDLAASALDGAIAGRTGGAPVLIVAGFAKGGVRIVGTFPADSHPPIVYPVAQTVASKSSAAKAYLDFLAGPDAKPLFEAQGFTVKH